MKGTILDYYAETQTPYLHGGGQKATYHLFEQLYFKGEEKVLEVGFGIAASLVSLYCHYPKLNMYGVERTPKMYETVLSRKRMIRGFNPQLTLLGEGEQFPFEKNFFDVVYIESVLGILSTE